MFFFQMPRNLQALHLFVQVPASPGVAGHYRTVALPAYNPQHTYAACVVGGGPAGLALAWQMAKAGLSVVVVDNAMANDWPNNYGVWAEEWHSMGLPEDTLAQTWEKTRIQYTTEEGDVLNRPYGRVDREVCRVREGKDRLSRVQTEFGTVVKESCVLRGWQGIREERGGWQ